MSTAITLQTLDRDWLTVKQAAAYLQVSTRTIARYIDRGTILASQFVPGGTVRISASGIEKMLQRK
jgi:excisionase family DNA binding protein